MVDGMNILRISQMEWRQALCKYYLVGRRYNNTRCCQHLGTSYFAYSVVRTRRVNFLTKSDMSFTEASSI